MFAVTVFAGVMTAGFAGDSVLAVQQRYPAGRTTITTAAGTLVFYTLPADAPPLLKGAYRGLEVAEREVLITEALQFLELEYIQNERRLEPLRTIYATRYLQAFPQSNRGPLFFNPNLYAQPESVLKLAVASNIPQSRTAERAYIAIDRLTAAHANLQRVLLLIARPDLKLDDPAPLPAAVAPPVKANPAPAPVNALREAEQAAARAEAEAEERERAARAKDLAAETRYRDSLPDDRTATRAAWLEARAEWEQARREWDAARARWQAARDRADAPRPRPAAPPVISVSPNPYLVPGQRVGTSTAPVRR